MEDYRDSIGKNDYPTPITEWTRSDEAPPGWRSKTLPLTPDATIKAVHEALEKVAKKIDPTSPVNKLTVSSSCHILASIINRSKPKRPLHRAQSNTIAKYFKPIQAATPRKRHLTEEGQVQSGPRSKVKSRKIYTPSTEEPVNPDTEYEHRQKRRAHREDDRIP